MLQEYKLEQTPLSQQDVPALFYSQQTLSTASLEMT